MTDTATGDAEDLEACVREDRRPREAGPYRVQIGDGLFRFRAIICDDALHTGRSLLELAGLAPVEQHVLFAVLADGLLEEIRLEEALDLREGVEKLLGFRSDRIFRFLIDGHEFHWGGRFLTGATVLNLAKADAAHGVWLRDADGGERRVGPAELIDLSQPGVETFVTRALAE
ncbi:multiubiquitin domain-containing protein [Phenylobacterium sp.]|uniref:multiubiquitin domain-containing protein n=1 Tax=Phenylobacterium sp. TaxID=1871053 RepID=UPI003565D604